MAFTHGKSAVFKLDNSAGTLTDISAYITSVTFDPGADVAETTTLGDSSKEYLAGLKDATLTIEGKFDPSADVVIFAALGTATTRTFEYGPEGGTTGKIKYSGETIGTAYSVSSGLDDASTFTATLQVTAGVTSGTFA